MDKVNTENPVDATSTGTVSAELPEGATQEETPAQPDEGMDPACRRELEIEIPAEVVAKQQEAIVQQYSKQARVPGFRKGKVPPSMVRTRFSSEITSDVVENLVPHYFREAVVKAGLRPVSQPSIHGLEFTPGEPIRFKATFEVLPDFELHDYKSIKVEKPEITVKDEAVEAEIKQFQERQASYDPVDEARALENGDFGQVSFRAVPKGMEGQAEAPAAGAASEDKSAQEQNSSQPVQMDDVLVEVGGAETIKEFTENLRGAKAGEERIFEVSYPEDFYDKRLAGNSFTYTVKINAIKKKTVPELNDAFAKELSQEFQTIDDLRGRIRENMETEQKHKAEHEAKDKLVETLVEQHDFAVPRSMVEHQIDLRLERGLRALAAQGMRTEDMKRMDFRRLRAGQREAAIKEVKSGVLLERIADQENLQITDAELEEEVQALAKQLQQTPDEVRRRLMKDGAIERIRARMRAEKALNFLYLQST